MAKRILIVEDEKGILNIISLFLKSQGFRTLATTYGTEAIEMVREQKPDLMLLDIFLPDISGFEVLKKVRQFSQIPIIVVSANTDAVERAIQSGANSSISKPFNPDHLLEKIQSVLADSCFSAGLDARLLKR